MKLEKLRLSHRILTLFSALLLTSFQLSAQSQNGPIGGTGSSSKIVRLSDTNGTGIIRFIEENQPFSSFLQRLYSDLRVHPQLTFRLKSQYTDHIGFTHYRYEQLFNGILVDGIEIVAHVKKGYVKTITGAIAHFPQESEGPTTPGRQISESSVLDIAKSHIGAQRYSWEPEPGSRPGAPMPPAPQPEKVYLPRDISNLASGYRLAFKINVEAASELYHADLYIDAESGTVLYENSEIHYGDHTGNGTTNYEGVKQFITYRMNSSQNYKLSNFANGNNYTTKTLNGGKSYYFSDEIESTDNEWHFATPAGKAAVDVHWGLERSLEIYRSDFSQNSYDNNGGEIECYVNYGNNLVNAFAKGNRLVFGDGEDGLNPVTELDVVGHEFTHQVVRHTSNLVYSHESGALNESFADIFGTYIEIKTLGDESDWLLGSNQEDGAFRSMSDPNSFRDPDTYRSTYWHTSSFDNFGVHTNSSVQNYWFYLLSEGDKGINSVNFPYDVKPIGLEKAAQIAFRTMTVYLTKNSGYAHARFYSILATEDLYPNEPDVKAMVMHAWDAVNVMGIKESCVVNIPDRNFKQAVLDLGIDLNGDGEVQCGEAEVATVLPLSNKKIANLQGIEAFKYITDLYVDGNTLTTLDVSQNKHLDVLYCRNNNLTDLNLTGLTKFNALRCNGNQLTELILPDSPTLEYVFCNNNNIQNIQFNNNTQLKHLECSYNQLQYLDVSFTNRLMRFTCIENPELFCVKVIDEEAANSNTRYVKEVYTMYTEQDGDCDCTLDIPDANFVQALVNHDPVIDTNNDGKIQCAEANVVEELFLSNSSIVNLQGLQGFTNLKKLVADHNPIQTFNFHKNRSLEFIDLEYNNMSWFSSESLPNLKELYLSGNKGLQVNSIYKSVGLEILHCNDMDLSDYSTFDIAENINLKELKIANSGLVKFDVSNQTKLEVLDCSGNDITMLEVNHMLGLKELDCGDNDLYALDISDNFFLTALNTVGNENLPCIKVIDVNAAQGISTFFKDSHTEYVEESCGCVVDIPDVHFKEVLINTTGSSKIDLNGDGEVQCGEAVLVKWISHYNGEIQDITGIEAFVNLESLNLYNHKIQSVDLTHNLKLNNVSFGGNEISSFEVSEDNIITQLSLPNNKLTSLDLTEFSALERVWLNGNKLTEVNFENNPNLTTVDIRQNNIYEVSFDSNPLLEMLQMSSNKLRTVDLSPILNLHMLDLTDNNLRSLDISHFNEIWDVRCTLNNDLYCIKVKDKQYADYNYRYFKDDHAEWQEECPECVVEIPDANFKNALLAYSPTVDTNGDGEIQCEEAEAVSSLMVFRKNIADLTGLQSFVNLKVLGTSFNPDIDQIDLTGLDKLEQIYSQENSTTSVIVGDKPNMTVLWIPNNDISSIDITGAPNLKRLALGDNNFTYVDLSNQTELVDLHFARCNLTSIDVSHMSNLEDLYISQNQISTLDLNQNISLEKLNVDFNNLTVLDVSNNVLLTSLIVRDNDLQSMDISNNTSLQYFNSWNNTDLTCIQVSSISWAESNSSLRKSSWQSWSTDCGNSSRKSAQNLISSIDEIVDFEGIKIYPNPTENNLNIQDSNAIGGESWSIYNLSGQLVKDGKLQGTFTTIDVSNFSSGIYLLKVVKENGVHSERITIR
ncbi:M4 family metallopeptidase [Aureibacter tunicatorum]|uniref:Zn-dependent metalloprotease/Leucine-rich repeat (LRR) protein n=1 Tax=Aureibacter tunicatorum TaxID=866807 RepID=A0AAE3XSG6_9BACT|nr:M4 family metallopeptidase [Aureibacter tunicatorum]MDR6241066.1 Zn-dependent metalloprotease/Leucine-rich repeat (LRR) protein [Aureibacter tunicatorum]